MRLKIKRKLMKLSGSRRRLFTRQFWHTVETKYYILFLLAVFFTFSSLGFVSDLLNNLEFSYSKLALSVFTTGLFSAGYAFSATKNLWLIPLFMIIQFLYMFFLRPDLGTLEMTADLHETKARVNAMGIMFSVISGYTFFVTFITKVGINHFLMKAEVDLAKEIHDVLVPEIRFKNTDTEVYGKSIPAQDVGGDLIDISEQEGSLICTISDVSGHGVSSGVYTGMFKSSLRTILKTELGLNSILTKINSSLQPLMKKNMFITTAMIKINNSVSAEFSVAGHLPILHFKKTENIVDELMIKQLPIGFKADFEFQSEKVNYEKGDMFVLITDGITETSNKSKTDFGLEQVKENIVKNSSLAPDQLANKLFDTVNNFGQQRDDVTLMVVRC